MRRLTAALAALLPVLLGPAGARAQRALVVPDPGSPVVAMSLDMNAGGIWDPPDRAGISRLAAETILEGLRPRLAPLGASGRLDCDRFGLRVTVLAPLSSWRPAVELVLEAVFHPELQADAFDSAHSRLVRSLRFQEGNPAAGIRMAAHEALFGENHRWAHAACGSVETLDSATIEEARDAAVRRFDPARATVALTGAIRPEEGSPVLGRFLADQRLPLLLPLPDPPPLAGSREVEAETITSWVALAYPLPREPDEEATRLLAQSVLEGVRPGPGRPHVVDADVEVERFGGGGALVVYVVAEPEDARRWLAQVRALVDSAGASPLDAQSFALLRRRYRGARLLGLAAPEARAADAADQLFFDHRYAWPGDRIEALTPERLRAAAAALGAPAAAYLGPDSQGATSLDRTQDHP